MFNKFKNEKEQGENNYNKIHEEQQQAKNEPESIVGEVFARNYFFSY